MRHRRLLASAFLSVALAAGLSACGGDSDEIKAQVDAASVGEQQVRAGLDGEAITPQQAADQDEEMAARAKQRREELQKLEDEQKQETERIMEEGVPGGNDEDSTIPIGSADPDVERFRAKLSGICAGGQKRIVEVSGDAEDAAKTKDPAKILAAAQAYALALNDFLGALEELDAPPSVRDDYRSWLNTINALTDNVRLQLVVVNDPERQQKLQAKTERLTGRLLEKSALLGVTCISVT